MRAKEVIKVLFKETSTWVDHTDGLLNVEIIRGVQQYQGPWQQADVGEIRILSRNTALDPYENTNIRVNKEIRVTANDVIIFTGKIGNINVEYRPKGQPPLITISGIDMIGSMQKHILSDSFIKLRPQNWGVNSLLQDIPIYDEIEGFVNNIRGSYGTPFNDTCGINSGTPAYQALASFSSERLGFIYADVNNEIVYYDNADYFPANTHPSTLASKAEFRSDGAALSYRTLSLNDGFDRIVNQIQFTNSAGSWTGSPLTWQGTSHLSSTYVNTASLDSWGGEKLNLNTYYWSAGMTAPTSDWAELANKIFIESSNPQREVIEISWDGMKDVAKSSDIDIYDNIDIYHQLDGVTIDRKYGIVGIRHSINESDWIVTYILKNFNYIETSMQDPIVLVDQESGDTNYNFTFTIDFPVDEIGSVVWHFPDGTTQTTQTANKTFASTGTKNITVTVTNIYGWTKTSDIKTITVVGALPTNTWTYSIDPQSSNLVHFNFTGLGANSYLWDFGDGTTSSEQSPSHAYGTSGSKTVTLTCTNSYGNNTTSQTFSVTVPTPIPDVYGTFPVRYIKLVQEYGQEGNYPNNMTSPRAIPFMYKFKCLSSTGTDLSINKPAISVIETKGFLSDGVYLGNGVYQDWDWILQPNRMTDYRDNTAYNGVAIKPLPLNSSWLESEWSITLDLQTFYNNINSFVMTYQGSGTRGNFPVKVYISTDNVNYVHAATFPSASGTSFIQRNANEVISLPANI